MAPRRILGAIGGAGLGVAVWLAWSGSRPEVTPSYWTVQDAPVPIEVAGLAGELRPDPAALDLWGYRAASPVKLGWTTGQVTLDARIPDGAELSLRFGAPMLRAVPEAPVGTVVPVGRGPAPDAAEDPDGDGIAIRFDRLRHRTRVTGAPGCAAGPEVGPNPHLVVTTTERSLQVEADGQPILRCETGGWAEAPPILASSVRRVQVTALRFVPTGGAAWEPTFGGPVRGWPGALIFAGVGAGLGALWGAPWLALTGALAGVAVALRWREALDALRLLAVPEALVPALIGGLPTALIGVATHARASLPHAAIFGLLPALAVAPTLATGAADASGWCLLALGFLPVALASHGSARRWHPLLLQALLLSVFPLAEAGLRRTRLDTDWSLTAGFTRAQTELRELLELRQYRDYPSEGFPARPPVRTDKRRIVAFGGSSTGGAYQMDDLSLFWPRHLQDRLPGWEVVNQGVGGWNTGHIRLYAEAELAHLAPEIVVLYTGHNDLLTRSTVPFREYVASYRASPDTPAALRLMRSFRLYNGLKYAIFAVRSGEDAVTVPLPDAEENLSAIIQLAQAQGAKVLLVTEAVNPDPTALAGYATMESTLAARTGSGWLDARARFFDRDEPLDFLDDCHLTVGGHGVLAELIDAELRRLGWI